MSATSESSDSFQGFYAFREPAAQKDALANNSVNLFPQQQNGFSDPSEEKTLMHKNYQFENKCKYQILISSSAIGAEFGKSQVKAVLCGFMTN